MSSTLDWSLPLALAVVSGAGNSFVTLEVTPLLPSTGEIVFAGSPSGRLQSESAELLDVISWSASMPLTMDEVEASVPPLEPQSYQRFVHRDVELPPPTWDEF